MTVTATEQQIVEQVRRLPSRALDQLNEFLAFLTARFSDPPLGMLGPSYLKEIEDALRRTLDLSNGSSAIP